jgi:hypothetical protein
LHRSSQFVEFVPLDLVVEVLDREAFRGESDPLRVCVRA